MSIFKKKISGELMKILVKLVKSYFFLVLRFYRLKRIGVIGDENGYNVFYIFIMWCGIFGCFIEDYWFFMLVFFVLICCWCVS